MLRQDKKFSIKELVELHKEVDKILTRLGKIDEGYFINGYARIIQSLDDMLDELKAEIGSLTVGGKY